MTGHIKRVITAFVGILLLIVIIAFAPPWVFPVLILLAALVSLNEFHSMMGLPSLSTIAFIHYSLTTMFFFFLLATGPSSLALLPFFVIVPFVFFIFTSQKHHLTVTELGPIIMGPFYICLPLAFFAIIATLPHGKMWIFFLLSVIFTGDIGSFYVGRLMGKHKLTPISPGKTWEGAFGGLLASMISAGVFGLAGFPALSLSVIMVLALSIGIIGQVGDLTESLLKRMANIKDSGTILPGHGGMLDRIDSLLFAAPVLYLYLSFQAVSGL